MRPVFLLVSNWEIAVFLIVPLLVTAMRYLSSLKFLNGMIVVMFSMFVMFRKFAALVPLAVLVASGISYALIL